MENNKKNLAVGSSSILIGSIFLILNIVIIAYSIYDLVIQGKLTLGSTQGLILIITNLIADLAIIAIVIFGIRQRKNIDAGKAIMNRGIFITIILAIALVPNTYFGVTRSLSFVIIFNGLLYAAGGKLNYEMAKRELMED